MLSSVLLILRASTTRFGHSSGCQLTVDVISLATVLESVVRIWVWARVARSLQCTHPLAADAGIRVMAGKMAAKHSIARHWVCINTHLVAVPVRVSDLGSSLRHEETWANLQWLDRTKDRGLLSRCCRNLRSPI